MSKQSEMESIFESFEWLIREKLEKLDSITRSMFSEMSTFGIPMRVSQKYVREKFAELINDVSKEGDEYHAKKRNRSR